VDEILERLDGAFVAAATHTLRVDLALVKQVRSRADRLRG
jgi:hypothetical protein